MPKPKPTETRKLTYAEAALLDLLPTLAVPDDARVLIAGNRSGWLPLEAEKKWPKRVAAHAFDFHHARAIRDRLAEAWINPNAIVHCTPALPEGPFALALFMTTPQSMSAELVLDQLEDLHANLAEGGTLVAAFEGDADEAPGRREDGVHQPAGLLLPPARGRGRTRPRGGRRARGKADGSSARHGLRLRTRGPARREEGRHRGPHPHRLARARDRRGEDQRRARGHRRAVHPLGRRSAARCVRAAAASWW